MKYRVYLLLLALLAPPAFGEEQKPLSGHVKKDSGRIVRPGLPLTGKTSDTGLQTHIDSIDFSIGTSKDSKPMSGGAGAMEMPSIAPISIAQPSFSSSASKMHAPAPSGSSSSSSGGGAAEAPNYSYSARPMGNGKKVLIRLKKFRSSAEMEVVWEAARMANRMLNKGANVTMLFDMEGVHAVDKNDTFGAELEENRGNGNSAAKKATSPQQELMQFVQNGGNVVASARWARLFAIQGGSLLPGARLVSDDEMADILIEPDCAVIDY